MKYLLLITIIIYFTGCSEEGNGLSACNNIEDAQPGIANLKLGDVIDDLGFDSTPAAGLATAT